MTPDEIDSAVKWYEKERPIYEAAADRIYDLIFDILDSGKVNFHNIESRAKEKNSFKEKLERNIVTDPKDMQDLVGVRIICYVESDVKKVSKIIEQNFKIDQQKTTDKTEQLGVDRVGYRSTHFVVKLDKGRANLPEYKSIKDIHFEIQIRTILQHAWAEFSHDRNYKFSGILPNELARKMNLLSGTLEIVDNEFQQLSDALGKYSKEVLDKTKRGELDILINSTSLLQYLAEKFSSHKDMIVPKIGITVDRTTVLIKELNKLDITTLKQLDKIIPKNLVTTYKKLDIKNANYSMILRNSMMIYDYESYFKKAYDKSYSALSKESQLVLKEYDIDLEKIKQYVKLSPNMMNSSSKHQ